MLRLHLMARAAPRTPFSGGLDEALHQIIETCRQQEVPFVFALSRRALGRCVNKMVPVSLVGIFNYDGAQVSRPLRQMAAIPTLPEIIISFTKKSAGV